MSSIKMSPKHGLNPCISVCAFCGEQKNEVAILGKLKGDAKAPMSAVINYKPCDKCLANWAQGVPLIRVTDRAPAKDAVPFQVNDGKRLYLTAQYAVITTDAAKRIFDIDQPAGSPVLVDEGVFDRFMEDMKKVEEQQE